MNLIRFGSLYINVDRITTIRDLTPDPETGPKLVRIEFDDGRQLDLTTQAAPFLNWAQEQEIAPAE